MSSNIQRMGSKMHSIINSKKNKNPELFDFGSISEVSSISPSSELGGGEYLFESFNVV